MSSNFLYGCCDVREIIFILFSELEMLVVCV